MGAHLGSFLLIQHVIFAWDYYCTDPGCNNQNISCPFGDVCNVHCDHVTPHCQNTKFIATHLVGGSFYLHSTGIGLQTDGAEVYCPKDGECSVLCNENQQAFGGVCQGLTIYATNSTYLYVYAFYGWALNDVTIYCPDTFGFDAHIDSCIIEVETYHASGTWWNELENTQIYNAEGFNHLNISCRHGTNALYSDSSLKGCNNEGDYQSPVLHCGVSNDMSCRLKSDDGKTWSCVSASSCSNWEYTDTSLPSTYPTNAITTDPTNDPSTDAASTTSFGVTNDPSSVSTVGTSSVTAENEISNSAQRIYIHYNYADDSSDVISYIISGCLFILLIGVCVLMIKMRRDILRHIGVHVKDNNGLERHKYSNLTKIEINTPITPSTPGLNKNNTKSIHPEDFPELPNEHESDEHKSDNEMEDLYDKDNQGEDEGKQTDTAKPSIS